MAIAPESAVGEEAAQQYALSGFPLRFRRPDAEAEYRAKWLSGTRATHKLWTGAAFLSYLGISLSLLWAAEPGFLERQWFRFAVCIPFQTLVLILVVTERYTARSYNPLFLFTTLALYGNAVFAYTFGPIADMRLHMFEFALIFVFSQCFYPAHWGVIGLFSLLATPMAMAGFIIADQGKQGGLVPLDMILLVTIGLAATCLFASYSREVLSRRNFQQLRILAEGKARSEQLAAEAQRAVAAKKQFMAMAAHELRTPLNGMIGFAELGNAFSAAEGVPANGSNPFPGIEREARHLAGLVEATLAVTAEGDSGLESPIKAFELDPFLSAIAEDHNSAGIAIDLQVDGAFGSSLSINGNPDLYRVVIESLIQQTMARGESAAPLILRTVQLNRHLIIEIGQPGPARDRNSGPDNRKGDGGRRLIHLLLESQNLAVRTAVNADDVAVLRVLVPMEQVGQQPATNRPTALRAVG